MYACPCRTHFVHKACEKGRDLSGDEGMDLLQSPGFSALHSHANLGFHWWQCDSPVANPC